MILDFKFLRLLLASILWVQASGGEAATPAVPAITTAAGVRALSGAEAAKQLPVRLRGVVTSSLKRYRWNLTMADATAGIYAELEFDYKNEIKIGSEIEVRGTTEPGGFAPYLKVKSLKVVGTASIPPPVEATYDMIMSGRLDAQRIQVEGIVRKSSPPRIPEDTWRLEIANGGGRVGVLVRGKLDEPVRVDAKILVTGVCFYQFTRTRQVLRPIVVSPGGAELEIITPPPAALALRPANNLMGFTTEGDAGHRVRVRGTVTHQVPGEAFWLDDSGHGLRVDFKQQVPLAPGELVEVLGFAASGDYLPVLEDVEVHRLAMTPPPAPRALQHVDDALDHDAELIRLDGWVTACKPVVDGYVLTLSEGGKEFSAHYPNRGESDKSPKLAVGSKLRLSGICVIMGVPQDSFAGLRKPDAFDLLIRSPADVTILKTAPWWNQERVVRILSGVCAALLLAAAVNEWRTRRQVREAAVERNQAEAEFAAIWTERNRIAHELHDTLAQGLGAISLHLELVKDHLPPGESAAQHLSTATQLTRDSLAEARDSIWNMRAQALETGDLPTALRDVLQHLSGIEEIETRFQVSGKARRLAPRIENNLLRIGQEAITNAVKHSGTRNVRMFLEFSPERVMLRVADDGCGFAPNGPGAEERHFGLVFMRERANEIQGEIQVRSNSGQGTEITLAVTT